MGLQFYFGGSGAGKSKRLHEDMVAWAQREPDTNILFLVPDQFTMQTQIDLVNASPNGGIMNIDVLSFGRLSHRIFEETGYGQKPVLDDIGKSLVLRKVAAGLQEQMPVIGKNLNKIGYIHEVKSAISEFKQYDISVTQVTQLADFVKDSNKPNGALYYKLKDLEVIYQGFTDYMSDRFITTEETLELLTSAVGRSKIIRSSVIVFDGFTGFTPIQYRLISELLNLTQRVIVSVIIDDNPFKMGGEQELFALSKKTVSQLCRLAAEEGTERIQDVYIEQGPLSRFGRNRELAHLERHLFRYPIRPCESCEHIQLWEALNPAQEVNKVCLQIKELVLEGNYSYRDIAVVTGDLATYADYFEREQQVYDIPFFIDRTRGLLLNPFIEYIRSALKMVLQNFSYEAVFHYLRCGLSDFTPEETDQLENYVLAFGIKGHKKWSQSFVRKEEVSDTEENENEQLSKQELQKLKELELLNNSREKLMSQTTPLLVKKSTAGELVRVLYEFIVAGRIQEKLAGFEQYFRDNNQPERAREYAQIYRLVMQLLEQIHELLEEESMTLEDFADILDAGFAEIQVGTIPGGVDRVMVGDMERSRLKQVKVLFFLGVNDGNIPKNNAGGGIISDIDRELLRGSQFELAPSPRQQMYIQRLYLYMNMTKPSEQLYVSYARISSEGKSIRPSYLIEMLQKLFPNIHIQKEEASAGSLAQIVGKRDGLTLLAGELREYAAGRSKGEGHLTEQELTGLYRIYLDDEHYKDYAQDLEAAAFSRYEHKPLAKAVARALYGSMLENSVSRLEKFASCAYAHFLQYGLRLQEREEFSFEQVDLGNVFHNVLESFAFKLTENQLTWFDFSEDIGDRLLREALEYSTMKYGETVLYSSARYQYMTERMYRILKRTIRTLQTQLREGDFMPESFEMSFADAGDLDAINIALSSEEKMKLRGRIDRIDTCQDESHVYVKVIDYKSGSRKFDLAALYYGLQLQLVIYMNVATQMEQKKYPEKEIIPAALLYYHVDDPLIKEEGELTPEEINQRLIKELRTTGLVNESDGVVHLLDKNFSDKSLVVPVERKKDGSFSANSSVISREDYETVSQYVNYKIKQFGREISNGNIMINPCSQGGRQSCKYCTFSSVCTYEPKIAGYELRILEDMPKEELLVQMQKQQEKG